jgi:hypothetical protein
MKRILGRNLRLRPSILTLFLVLTVPVFCTIVAVTYLSNERIARANADALVKRFRTDALDSIRNLYFGKRWQLFIITPLHDFTSPFENHDKRLLVFGLIAIALQIVIIYFLSTVISSPLARLAFKVAKIQDLGSRNLPPLESPICEIAVLSKAVDMLDAAVKSFAAFVPVDLVRQLVESEQKLKLR